MNTNGCAPPSDLQAAFVLLAAGRGARFGDGKLLADLCGRPLWQWAIASAREAGFRDLHVVANDPAITADCAAEGIACHPNPCAEEGIASSIRVGVSATTHAWRVVLALADMPFVGHGHLRRLGQSHGAAFTRQADGRPGVPAAFGREALERLLTLGGDRGAASLDWPNAQSIEAEEDACLLDVDTPAALEEARAYAIRRWPAACR